MRAQVFASHPGRRNPRYNGPDDNERKYPRYANIGRVPDHLRRAGRKRVRKRRGAHVPRICIPPDAPFAYGEICIPRTYARTHTRSRRIALPCDRSIERNSGIGATSSPSSRLLIRMHTYDRPFRGDEQKSRRAQRGKGGLRRGPRRRDNILREQNGANIPPIYGGE